MENKTHKEAMLDAMLIPTQRKDRGIVLRYDNEAKTLRMIAALLDTSVKDMMLHATMSYLTNLATTTDDTLLKSILKGEVKTDSGLLS